MAVLLLQMACPTQTTLAAIGPRLEPLAKGVIAELGNLVTAKVITRAQLDDINSYDPVGRAKALGDFLTNLKTITASNKQAVIDEIQKVIDLYAKIGPKIKPDTTAAKVFAVITATLIAARLAVDLTNPPAQTMSFSIGQPEKGIDTKTVKVNLPPVSNDVKKYIH